MPHLAPIKEATAKQNRHSDALANLSWQMAAETHIGNDSQKIVQKIEVFLFLTEKPCHECHGEL